MAVLVCPLKGAAAKRLHMKKCLFVAFAALMLNACSQEPTGVRVTQEAPPAAAIVVKPRTEPVFYNGKTYQVSLSPAGNGAAQISIAGMNENQKKDASGLATSALHHFTCKDSQKAVLLSLIHI